MKVKDWGFVEWLIQVTWLIILVCIVGGGSYWVVNFYETTTLDPNSLLGILATFIILVPVIGIFLAQWLFKQVLLMLGFKEKE